jgi:hypothetical protein
VPAAPLPSDAERLEATDAPPYVGRLLQAVPSWQPELATEYEPIADAATHTRTLSHLMSNFAAE